MHTNRRLTLLAGALSLAALLVASANTAFAEGPECIKEDPASGQCLIFGGGTPIPRGPGSPERPGGPGDSGGQPVGNPVGCFDDVPPPAVEVPCSQPSPRYSGVQTFWSNGRDCYVGRMTPQPVPADPVWQGRTAGAIYFCEPSALTRRVGMVVDVFWSAAAPVAAMPPDPETLARQAIATMDLRAIEIGIVPEPNPDSMGFVGLPTWMWTDPTPPTWGPITRSANGGGITVTATGRVKTVAWQMGDGATVNCGSPGTPYQDAFGKSSSPTCGHSYTRTSVGKPGDAYPVSATSYWAIDWAGGGESGTINLDFTADTQVRMGELQVLVTG